MKEEIKLSGIPSMSVEKVIEQLSLSYTGLIKSGCPLKSFPSVMLWGPPGIGKSQAIRQIAKEIENNTSKKVNITDVRLLLFNPIDLRGIPTANEDKTLAVWLKPQIFQMDESDNVINILFLDEISAAPQSVQAAAYQITLDRVVGEHKLPENCIVIAAGNRTTDKSVSVKMPKALANRLLHIEVVGSFDSWKNWAISHGINEKIIGFLTFKRDALMMFSSENDDLAFATPRSWEMVSNILNNINDSVDKMFPLICGLIGNGTARELKSWVKIYKNLPNIEDIFLGKQVDVPKAQDTLYALITSMVAYAREHKDNLDLIGNSIRYANKMPPDFSVVLIKDYMAIEKNYRNKLVLIPEFTAWIQSKGKYLNGSN
ncbi:MAG: MoxR family ATPase [Clostridia bacterium]|nr:MoxR family ATPase [Clostridia bacterium]